MSMNLGSGGDNEPDVMIDVNTTPLIDVMLVLLVMLIITIPIQTHAVKLDMPQATPPTADDTQPPPVVDLEIDFDGTIIWNGETIPSRHMLEVRLLQAANEAQQPEFHIRPNKLVEYKYVAEVLASAQRLGVTNIGLVGNEAM